MKPVNGEVEHVILVAIYGQAKATDGNFLISISIDARQTQLALR